MANSKGSATGMAFYGLPDQVDAQRLLEIAQTFFVDLGLKPNTVSYSVKLPQNARGEDIGWKKADISTLREALATEGAHDFYLECVPPKSSQWICSASFLTTWFLADKEEYDNAGRLVCTYYCADSAQLNRIFMRLAREMDDLTRTPYAIAYEIDGDLADVSSYANADGFLTIFKNEDARAWKTQLPLGSRNVPKQYVERMRMVYPCNLLGPAHLAHTIEGGSLYDWIHAASDRGALEALASGGAVWTVAPEHLERINSILGEAGLLIGWKPKPSALSSRRLPG
ncbi:MULTISPECIES: hypothetical protein [Lysobacter]|nr:hypothetical protein [Lysobacter enzymogenes]QQQ01321.1 hypothetical protein JHW41_25350 [Lysobacter enzymogenes]